MDEMSPVVTSAPLPGKMTPLERAAVTAAVFLVGTAAVVALEGGRPASLWFYPYVALLDIAAIYRAYTNKSWGRLIAVPGESKLRSFEWALLEAAVVAVLAYLLYALLSTDQAFRRSGWMLPVFIVYIAYCRRRGEKPSTKTLVLLMLAGLAWFAVVLELIRALR